MFKQATASSSLISSLQRTRILGSTASRLRHTHASTSSIASSSTPLDHRKRAFRGGQNLSDRYKRLEKSLRGKIGRTDDITRDISSTDDVDLTSPTPVQAAAVGETFRGLVIPKEPKPPESDGTCINLYLPLQVWTPCYSLYSYLLLFTECCMSGCAICVYDLYDEALTQYREAVQTLRTSLAAMNVPEHEWPRSIRTNPQPDRPAVPTQKTVSVDAFEEMERQLREKKEREAKLSVPAPSSPSPSVSPTSSTEARS